MRTHWLILIFSVSVILYGTLHTVYFLKDWAYLYAHWLPLSYLPSEQIAYAIFWLIAVCFLLPWTFPLLLLCLRRYSQAADFCRSLSLISVKVPFIVPPLWLEQLLGDCYYAQQNHEEAERQYKHILMEIEKNPLLKRLRLVSSDLTLQQYASLLRNTNRSTEAVAIEKQIDRSCVRQEEILFSITTVVALLCTVLEIGRHSYPNTYYPIANRIIRYLHGHASDTEPKFIHYETLRGWERRSNPDYRP